MAREDFEKSAPRCPECGYITIGLPEPRCPECGSTFSWGRALPDELLAEMQIEVRRERWFSLLGTLAMGVGIGLIFWTFRWKASGFFICSTPLITLTVAVVLVQLSRGEPLHRLMFWLGLAWLAFGSLVRFIA